MTSIDAGWRITLLFGLLLIGGCTAVGGSNTGGGEDMCEELMQADRDFASAVEKGGLEAWMSHFAPDACRPELGGDNVQGLENIRALDQELLSNENVLLVWEPTSAGVFADGEHGFTTGRFELSSLGDGQREVQGTGSYVSVWRRIDGEWKVILDTGAPDPPETD